jgi:hypothetical protein
MKLKVCFLDKRIRHNFYKILSIISVIASIVFLFVNICPKYKTAIGIIVFVLLVIVYIGIWIYANKRQDIKLKINNSEIEIKFGDLFTEIADWKVIAFNEYFDTLVDDKIIAKNTLNGIFIEKFYKENIEELDRIIATDTKLEFVSENIKRSDGKKKKYKLGSICVVGEYFLTALTRFDDQNRAYLSINDYINFLLYFWAEIDRVYAGKTVALPVLGSGITRFKGYENISDQELLELIIWAFKVSRIKFTYPSKVKIIVFTEKSDKINLTALKDLE